MLEALSGRPSPSSAGLPEAREGRTALCSPIDLSLKQEGCLVIKISEAASVEVSKFVADNEIKIGLLLGRLIIPGKALTFYLQRELYNAANWRVLACSHCTRRLKANKH